VPEVKSAEQQAQDLENQQIEYVREQLKKAAEIKNPKDMWYAVKDILDLLTLLIVPAR